MYHTDLFNQQSSGPGDSKDPTSQKVQHVEGNAEMKVPCPTPWVSDLVSLQPGEQSVVLASSVGEAVDLGQRFRYLKCMVETWVLTQEE